MESYRQCIVCRKRYLKQDLLRVVRIGNRRIAFDPRKTLQGRGFYLCNTVVCIKKARAQDSLSKKIGQHVSSTLYEELARYSTISNEKSIQTILGFAYRARCLVPGVSAVENGVKRGRIGLIVIDRRTGPSTRKRLKALSASFKVKVIFLPDKISLESVIGKPACKCAGISNPEFSQSILNLYKTESWSGC